MNSSHLEILEEIDRFDVGERSDFINLPMANTALRQILAWGVDNIAETLTGQIEKNLAESRFKAVPANRRMSHITSLRVAEEVEFFTDTLLGKF